MLVLRRVGLTLTRQSYLEFYSRHSLSQVTKSSRLTSKTFRVFITTSKTTQRTMATQTKIFQEQSDLARHIFLTAVNSVKPSELMRSKVSIQDNILSIDGKQEIFLDQFNNCHVIGFGKAVLPMTEEIVPMLGPRCTSCVISVPEGTRESNLSTIVLYRGAKDNIPDENAAFAAGKILDLVRSCQAEDLLIVLISGGGSALLPVPKHPITISEKSQLIKRLSTCGATINELNTVRKQLSLVKGGGLVEQCSAKKIISLILSDVLGDPLDIIASGPTVLHQKSNEQETPQNIVKKYIPTLDLPQSILTILNEKSSNLKTDKSVQNFIIGNNKVALTAALQAVDCSKYASCILTDKLEGEARTIGTQLSELAHFIGMTLHNERKEVDTEKLKLFVERLNIDSINVKNMEESILTAKQDGRKLCLILGGEPVVKVKGAGVGGRNQELALAAAIKLNELKSDTPITIFSAGSDGIDGPTPMAGAVVNLNTIKDAMTQNVDSMESLDNNNSYHFFKQVSEGLYHVFTGHTGTNVMDIVVILID